MDIGTKIKRLRENKNISQTVLAGQLGIAQNTLGLIENGELWMDMIKSRNKTSHTYDEAIANEIVKEIINRYYSEFIKLYNKLNEIKEKEEKQL